MHTLRLSGKIIVIVWELLHDIHKTSSSFIIIFSEFGEIIGLWHCFVTSILDTEENKIIKWVIIIIAPAKREVKSIK